MTDKNIKNATKNTTWYFTDENPSTEQLKLSCLMRIADAVETLTKKYADLESSLDWYKQRYAAQSREVDRLIASRAGAGQVTIPAVVRDVADEDVLRLQIIENVQREGVPFMEEAYAIKKLRGDGSLDVKELAKLIGKSEAYVYFMLALCEMTDDARTIAEKGWISKGVAWEISKLRDAGQQTEAANALARTNNTKLITISGAKNYIRDNFGDSPGRLQKKRVETYGPGSEFTANWKRYLVQFTAPQFEHFKKIVRGRTETQVLAEAVDLVMRRAENGSAEAANAL